MRCREWDEKNKTRCIVEDVENKMRKTICIEIHEQIPKMKYMDKCKISEDMISGC